MMLQKSPNSLVCEGIDHDGEGNTLVTTSPNWLTNKVFGEVFFELGGRRQGRNGLIVTEEDTDDHDG
jgi:hypothetical protein